MKLALAVALAACSTRDATPTAAELGERLFTDQTLSTPAGQSCADCHAPAQAFRDPESDHTTSMGVVKGRFAARNSPSLMYARFVPPRELDVVTGTWHGGLFWDGHADTLEEQAVFPLLNPLEMNNPDRHAIAESLRRGPNAAMFRRVFGADALDDDDRAVSLAAVAIAEYERGDELSPFASRYDRFLAGDATLSPHELHGLELFEQHCSGCHPPPLFTTFGYANLGIPRYANSVFLQMPPPYNPDGQAYVDHGLGDSLGDPRADGLFRIPSLRDVSRTAPYGHNGYFENLPYMLDFLATRDIGSFDVATCTRQGRTRCPWPAPEVSANVDPRVGHLDLDDEDLADLAAFLATLADPPPPKR